MKEIKQASDLTITRYTVDSFLSNMFVATTEQSRKEGCALVVDAIHSEEAKADLNEAGISRLVVVLTHEHFDHTTGLNWLRENFNCHVICQEICGEKVSQKRNNRSLSIMGMDEDSRKYRYYPPYECHADEMFSEEHHFTWCGREIHLRHTPGHTEGSCCMEVGNCAFVGDLMLLNEPVLTRLPGGSQQEFDGRTLPYLLSFHSNKLILPGHGNSYLMGDAEYRDGCFRLKKEISGNSNLWCSSGLGKR